MVSGLSVVVYVYARWQMGRLTTTFLKVGVAKDFRVNI
jgi:hypothetical protein